MIAPHRMTTSTLEANLFLYGFMYYKTMKPEDMRIMASYLNELADRREKVTKKQ